MIIVPSAVRTGSALSTRAAVQRALAANAVGAIFRCVLKHGATMPNLINREQLGAWHTGTCVVEPCVQTICIRAGLPLGAVTLTPPGAPRAGGGVGNQVWGFGSPKLAVTSPAVSVLVHISIVLALGVHEFINVARRALHTYPAGIDVPALGTRPRRARRVRRGGRVCRRRGVRAGAR